MVRAACALNTPKAMVIIRNTMINPWLERVRNTRRKEAYNAGLQKRLNSEKISHTTSGSTRTIKRPAPIINRLLGENRCIVSDIAGTTRDAIDTAVTWNGKEYVFIDTAGLRRKSKIKEELERYSIIRTVKCSSNAAAFCNAVRQTIAVAESGIIADITQNVDKMKVTPEKD